MSCTKSVVLDVFEGQPQLCGCRTVARYRRTKLHPDHYTRKDVVVERCAAHDADTQDNLMTARSQPWWEREEAL